MADWFAQNAPKPAAGGNWFAANAPKEPEQAKGVMEHVENFAKNFWGDLAATGQGMVNAVAHPVDTVKGIGAAQDAVRQKAADAMKRGDYVEAARHALHYLIPVAGPAIDARGDQAQAGDVSGALGGAASIGLQLAAPGAMEANAAKIVPAVETAGAVTKAAVKAGAPDVLKGAAKVGVGTAAAEMLPGGPVKYMLAYEPVRSGTRQIGRGVKAGYQAGKATLAERIAAATERIAAGEATAAGTAGEALARQQGLDWSKLKPEEQAMLEHAAKAQQNAAQAAPPPRPFVGPQQPVEEPAPPAARAKTAADLLQEEMAAKRAAAQPAPETQPQAPPPRTEVIQQTPTAPAAEAGPVSKIDIGRKVMAAMGATDITAEDAALAYHNLEYAAGKSGKPIEALYQKYTGEPFPGVAEAQPAPAAPAPKPRKGTQLTQEYLSEPVNYGGQTVTRAEMMRDLQSKGATPQQISAYLGGRDTAAQIAESKPLTNAQAEAAMARKEPAPFDAQAARSPVHATGETKSKAFRGQERVSGNIDAKAKRFADAFHAEEITAEDVGNMTASDFAIMTEGLVAKGVLKQGEMPPNQSIPLIRKYLRQLEKQRPAEPVAAPQAATPTPVAKFSADTFDSQNPRDMLKAGHGLQFSGPWDLGTGEKFIITNDGRLRRNAAGFPVAAERTPSGEWVGRPNAHTQLSSWELEKIGAQAEQHYRGAFAAEPKKATRSKPKAKNAAD